MTPNTIAHTPQPPYYAVIFTSLRNQEAPGYDEMAEKMFVLAAQQPGFLGAESARNLDRLGITVSYWDNPQAIRNWKANAEHRIAQETGKKLWYADYCLRIAKVERDYGKPPLPGNSTSKST